MCSYMADIVSIINIGMTLELKHILQTSLITVCLCYMNRSFHFNNYLKQLYISNKTEHFSYKSGCGMMHIEAFKIRADLGYRQMASGY